MNLVAMRCSSQKTTNLTVESVCASAMRVYKDPSDGLYRIWCSCCKGHISSSGRLQFNSLHDALEEIPYASIFHRMIWVIGSSEGNSVDVEEFNCPYWLLPHHLSSNMQSLKSSPVCPVQSNITTVLGMTNF